MKINIFDTKIESKAPNFSTPKMTPKSAEVDLVTPALDPGTKKLDEVMELKGIEPSAADQKLLHDSMNTQVLNDKKIIEQMVEEEPDSELVEYLELPESVKAEIRNELTSTPELKEALKEIILDIKPDMKFDKNISVDELVDVLKSAIAETAVTEIIPKTDMPEFISEIPYQKEALENEDLQPNQLKKQNQRQIPTDLSRLSSSQNTQPANNKDFSVRSDFSGISEFSGIREDDGGLVSLNPTVKSDKNKPPIENEILSSDKYLENKNISKKATFTQETTFEPESDELEDVIEKIRYLSFSLLQNMDKEIAESDKVNLKTYVVDKITDMTIRAKNDFDIMQKTAIEAIEQKSPKGIKESIEILTQAINKSEFALLADMQTEKELLLMLADLEKANSAFKINNNQLALSLLNGVKSKLEEMKFEPSVKRIQAFAMQKFEEEKRNLSGKKVSVEDKIKEALGLFSGKTSRDIIEILRFTGQNHEIEIMENSKTASSIKNLKEIFLKLSENNNEGSKSQGFSHFSGQQMLNDSNDSQRSFYVFDLPIQIEDEIDGMKVFISGKSEENRIDWKNCELYFGLDLAKVGKLGIKMSIANANLKLEILSDNNNAFYNIEKIVPRIQELGYRSTSIVKKGFDEKDMEDKSRVRLDDGMQRKVDYTI